MSKMSILCVTGTITFLTTYFYYILIPKSNYMVLHLTTKEQTQQWLSIYKTIQWNYHMGLRLGIIAVLVFSKSFC